MGVDHRRPRSIRLPIDVDIFGVLRSVGNAEPAGQNLPRLGGLVRLAGLVIADIGDQGRLIVGVVQLGLSKVPVDQGIGHRFHVTRF